MAGIGFEIRKILQKDSLLSVLQAYGYAGLIGSGPWVISILAMVLVGFLSIGVIVSETLLIQFLVTVTYLMAGSLIVTGGLQLMLTRFVSDLLFTNNDEQVLPNVLGAMCITTVVAVALGTGLFFMLAEQTLVYRVMAGMAFVVLCNLWLVVIFLSGLKEYRLVLIVMVLGYGTMIGLSYLLREYQIDGLLLAFLLSHALLLFAFLSVIIRRYPPQRELVAFDFCDPKRVFFSLFLCGLVYNLAVWVDKLIFWFTTHTSEAIVGPLRASLIYDIPIFLAYLSIIPGMAVFLVRIETDFAEQHARYYAAVLGEANLNEVLTIKEEMVEAVRRGLYEIFKIQGITVVVLLVWGGDLLALLGIDRGYQSLLNIDVVGVGVQVIFLSILNVLFYLDRRFEALVLVGLFLVGNALFTWLSIYLGAQFYGYGFVMGITLPSLLGLVWLNRVFAELEYETYMLQR